MADFKLNPNTGSLFIRRATNNQPNMDGSIAIGDDVISYIMDCAKRREMPIIRVAAWENNGNGPAFNLKISLKKAPNDLRTSGYGNQKRGYNDSRDQARDERRDERRYEPNREERVRSYADRDNGTFFREDTRKNPWE